MREEYHVTLYSQMGPREGRLDLQYEGSAVTDPEYIPEPTERKQVFGITFEQGRNKWKGICASPMLSGRRSAPFSARRRWSSMGNASLE